MDLFELVPSPIPGFAEFKPRVMQDHRGKFVKLFHHGYFAERGYVDRFEEAYYSVSPERVLRGLHFQTPPHAHTKLVTCVKGKILDVVVDLRKSSPTYLQTRSTILDAETGNLVHVPEGLAHGFYVLSEQCIFLSMNSRKFSADCDTSIRWNSIDFDWPDKDPIVSVKDQEAIPLNEYQSPFL